MGDFLRVGMGATSGEALERWVEEGLAFAEAKRGAAWHSAYATGAVYAFILRPARASQTRETLVGVIKPSTDAVGRRFPLVLYSPALAGTAVPWPHVLPMAYGDFLDSASMLLSDAETVSGVAQMQAFVSRVGPPTTAVADQVAQEYEMWAATTPLERAWTIIFGADSALSAPRAVHTILEAVGPFRGDASPPTRLGLRLPLGPGGIAAAAFWLDTLRRVSRTPPEIRTCFWSFDGATGSAIVQLGDTPASSLAELWSPDANSENLCDLGVPSSVDVGRFLTRLPPAIADVLRSPHALVRDFLDLLTQ
jgi:type VI secretion system ImpM family protein